MSHFVNIKTAIKDLVALLRALARLGFTADMVEVHKIAQNLYGYQNDVREQKAHVILRRKYVGSCSNDIGFERQANGHYIAHISEYDHGQYGEDWQKKLYTYYGVEKAKLEFDKEEISYTEELDEKGRIKLTVCNL